MTFRNQDYEDKLQFRKSVMDLEKPTMLDRFAPFLGKVLSKPVDALLTPGFRQVGEFAGKGLGRLGRKIAPSWYENEKKREKKTKKKYTKTKYRDDEQESIFREKLYDLLDKEEKAIYRTLGFEQWQVVNPTQGTTYHHGWVTLANSTETGDRVTSTQTLGPTKFREGTPHVHCVNSTEQGSMEYNRIGKRINLKHDEISFYFKWTGPTEWEAYTLTSLSLNEDNLIRKKEVNLNFTAFLVYDKQPCLESTDSGTSLDINWSTTWQDTASSSQLIKWMNQIWEGDNTNRWPTRLVKRETRSTKVNDPSRFTVVRRWDWTVTPSNTSIQINERVDLAGLRTTYKSTLKGDHNIQLGALYFVFCPPPGHDLTKHLPNSKMDESTDILSDSTNKYSMNLYFDDYAFIYDFKSKLIFSDI